MRFIALLVTVFWVSWLICPVRLRAEEPPREYQLKLAFIVNFARFISWPESSPADDTLKLCVFGDNPFGSALLGVEGKKVGGNRLKTMVIGSLAAAGECHVLFVPENLAEEFFRQSGDGLSGTTVAVGDDQGFVERGGGIEFVARDGRLGFVINNSLLKEKGIQVGSSLLSLAATVR